MSLNASPYPYWERYGPVSRFFSAPGLAVYCVEEFRLLGGSLFVASALEGRELIGQFESEHNARQACARDFAQRKEAAQAQHWRTKGS